MHAISLGANAASVIRLKTSAADGGTVAVVACDRRGGHTVRWLRAADGQEVRCRDLPASTLPPALSGDLSRIAWAASGPKRRRLFLDQVTTAGTRQRELIWWGEMAPGFVVPLDPNYHPKCRFAAISLSEDGAWCRVTEPPRNCFFGWELGNAFAGPPEADAEPISYCANTGSDMVFGNRIEFGPDYLAAIGDAKGRTSLVRADGDPENFIDSRDGAVMAFAFSPDGQCLCISAKKAVRVYEGFRPRLAVPTARFKLDGHKGLVHGVAYDGDGSRLLTVGEDGTARLWNASSGLQIRSWDWKSGPLAAAAFSPDGLTAYAGGDGVVLVWNLDG